MIPAMLSLLNRVRRSARQAIRLGVGGAWCLLGLAAPAVHAAPVKNTITVTTNYYFVTGTTAAGIYQSLQQARPWRWTSGHDAQTLWDTRHHFTFQQTDGRYAATGFELKTKVRVTLPFWQMPKDASPDLRQRWLDYVRNLYVHEQGHLDLTRQAVAGWEQRLGALGDFASAHELRSAIGQVGSNVLARVRRQEADYDAKTQHGVTQGAVFRIEAPTAPPRDRP